MTQSNETERIIKLLLYVRENGPVDLASIRRGLPYEYGKDAGSEDSTRRRFERDKKTLQAQGVYLDIDDRQRYSIDMSRTLAAPLNVTKPQVSLLRLLCSALLEDEGYPFKEELRMVLVKLSDELEVPDMLPHYLLNGGNVTGRFSEPKGLSKVKKAITTRKRLDFTYEGTTGTRTQRTVEPFGCFFLHGICYVVAYDTVAGGDRCFRLDRMVKPHVNASNPKTPDFEERDFDVDDYYGLPFQFGDEDVTARIRLDADVEGRLDGVRHGKGTLDAEDDILIWSVTCRNADALARWCIENGPGLHIIEPESARQAYLDGLSAYIGDAERGLS